MDVLSRSRDLQQILRKAEARDRRDAGAHWPAVLLPAAEQLRTALGELLADDRIWASGRRTGSPDAASGERMRRLRAGHAEQLYVVELLKSMGYQDPPTATELAHQVDAALSEAQEQIRNGESVSDNAKLSLEGFVRHLDELVGTARDLATNLTAAPDDLQPRPDSPVRRRLRAAVVAGQAVAAAGFAVVVADVLFGGASGADVTVAASAAAGSQELIKATVERSCLGMVRRHSGVRDQQESDHRHAQDLAERTGKVATRAFGKLGRFLEDRTPEVKEALHGAIQVVRGTAHEHMHRRTSDHIAAAAEAFSGALADLQAALIDDLPETVLDLRARQVRRRWSALEELLEIELGQRRGRSGADR